MSHRTSDPVRVPDERLAELGLVDDDASVLSTRGLPQLIAPVFTCDVVGGPDFLSVHEFRAAGEDNKTIVIGGVPGDPAMRYFVDANVGYVGLIVFQGERSQSEIVNRSLTDFVLYLEAIDAYNEKTLTYADLVDFVENRDPVALQRRDGWWTAVLEIVAPRLGRGRFRR